MLTVPRAKDKPMLESIHQAIRETDGSSIPKFVDHGLRALYKDADAVEEEWRKSGKILELE